MLTKPAISDESVIACVRDSFGLRITHAAFLPLGADINGAVYRVTSAEGMPYFLKLRRGHLDEITLAVPAFLLAQGIRRVMAPLATTTGQLWALAQGFAWILYPYFEGRTGYEATLLMDQFRPNNVVKIAHRSYPQPT